MNFDLDFSLSGSCWILLDLEQNHFVEEGTQGLHYCELKPYEDDVLAGTDLDELEELHSCTRNLCHGFLAPFKVRI